MFDFNNITDLNGDGVIDQSDAELAESIGDLNGDGIIDRQDIELSGINLADIAAAFNGGVELSFDDLSLELSNTAEAVSAGGSHAISFGSSTLSDPAWQDGVRYDEITPENMSAMADQIMSLFVKYGVDTHEINGGENVFMSLDHPEFSYDPNLMWTLGQRYGADAITGITGHEIGHHIVETNLADDINVTDWQHELCADYISGIVSQLNGVDHEVMHNMYADPGFAPASDTHPSGGLRSQAYDMGVEWAQNSSNSVFHEFLLTNESQLESMFQSVLDIFPGSYNEYIDL